MGWLLLFVITYFAGISAYHSSKAHQKTGRIMAQIDDLNAAVDNISSGIAVLNTDVQTILADFVALQAAQANGGPVDLTAPITRLQGLAANLASLDSAVKADLPAGVVVPAPVTTEPSA
jgi:uncharacterized protein (DUF3084 family)